MIDDRLGFDLDLPAGIEQSGHNDHGGRRSGGGEEFAVDGPTAPASVAEVRNMRVRTMSARSAPTCARDPAMMAKHRRACAAASSGQFPSGQMGPVPETRMRSPERTRRLKPMTDSKGEPEETRVGSRLGRGCVREPRPGHVDAVAIGGEWGAFAAQQGQLLDGQVPGDRTRRP